MWIFGMKHMYCLFECFPGDFSECFLYFDSSKGKQDTSLVYTVDFPRKLTVKVSPPHTHMPIPLFSHRYTILTREMATQGKDDISRLPRR